MSSKIERYEYGRPLPRVISDAIEHMLMIENDDAKSAGRLGFMARGLTQATMPYKDPLTPFYQRKNGDISLTIVSASGKVPSGRYPRLLLSWICSQAVKTKCPEIELGSNLGQFLALLDIKSGKSASILSDQMERLFTSLISIKNESQENPFRIENIMLAKRLQLDKSEAKNLWAPLESGEVKKWNSRVLLTTEFFQEITEKPIPIDLLAYKALSKSPLAMDIYCWLTYKMSFLKSKTRPIPWRMLKNQFGSGYAETDAGDYMFKQRFIAALTAVHEIYREAGIEVTESGLILSPSNTHIPAQQQVLFT